MRRTIYLMGNDGDTKISITAKIKTNGHLAKDEVSQLTESLRDGLVDTLREVRFFKASLSEIKY